MLNLAKELVSWGISVVPVPQRQKSPAIAWKEFQSRLATDSEIERWFSNENGIGIVCGKVSGNLVCLDFDSEEAYEAFIKSLTPEQLAIVESLPLAQSHKGKHLFFRATMPTASTKLSLRNRSGSVGDLQSNGKLVVIPPTLHPSGFVRFWIRPLTKDIPKTDLQEIGLLHLIVSDSKPTERHAIPSAIPEGSRHTTLTQYAGHLRHSGMEYDAILATLNATNQSKCSVPLPFFEIEGIARFVASKPVPSLRKANNDDELKENNTVIPNLVLIGNDECEESPFRHLFKSAPDYLRDANEGQMDWLVEGFLPLSYLIVLGATSKAGKSCLVTYLADSVAKGLKFLGMPTVQGAVLWLAYEESNAERCLVLKEYRPAPENLYITHEKIMLDSKEDIEALRWWIRKVDARLLVIDPLYGAVKADTLSDGRKARTALEGLKELCRTENVCAMVLHHFTKNVNAGTNRERFADSNQILATASMDLLMETTLKGDGSRTIKLSGTGRGKFANTTWLIESKSETEFELVASGTSQECNAEQRDEDILKALRETPNGLTAEQIANRTNQNPKSVRNRLTDLKTRQIITSIGKVGNAQVYGIQQELQAA